MKLALIFILITAALFAAAVIAQGPPNPIPPKVDFQICGQQVVHQNDLPSYTAAWHDEGCTDFHFRSVGSPFVFGYGTRVTVIDP